MFPQKLSDEHVVQDVRFLYSGQPHVESLKAYGEAMVIEAELMQDSGMKVPHVYRVLDGPETELVRLPVNTTGAEATSGQPHREGIYVMIAAG